MDPVKLGRFGGFQLILSCLATTMERKVKDVRTKQFQQPETNKVKLVTIWSNTLGYIFFLSRTTWYQPPLNPRRQKI